MNKTKKTTLMDRIRKAWRAFCNKPASSIALGIELKRCCECERRKQSDIAKEILEDFDRHGVYSKEYTDFLRKEYGVVEDKEKQTEQAEQTGEKYFTPDEVQRMTAKEVRENYTAIMRSMKEWK